MANVKQVQWATPTVMTGTGREVIQLLHRSPTQRTVAVSLPNNEQGLAAEIVFKRVVEFPAATDRAKPTGQPQKDRQRVASRRGSLRGRDGAGAHAHRFQIDDLEKRRFHSRG